MLWRDDRLDNVGDIVYIGKGFYAEQDIVERLFGRMSSVFWGSDDCELSQWGCKERACVNVPAYGLNRSLP